MITKITGKLLAVEGDTATLQIDSFEYEVLIPDFNRRQLQTQIGQSVSLHTLHYLEGNAAHGGRLTPRLVGFLREVEREFFEMICSVDGVGVRKALRAMVRPVQDVAVLIEEQDAKALSALPGVGPATAERIIAKLRRKMPKFAPAGGLERTAGIGRRTECGGRHLSGPLQSGTFRIGRPPAHRHGTRQEGPIQGRRITAAGHLRAKPRPRVGRFSYSSRSARW